MSKIGLFCDKVIEAGWLAAIIIAPLFINFHSSITFDPDKSIIVRSIALLMLTAFVIRKLERGTTNDKTQTTAIIKHPIVWVSLLFAMSCLISTFLSVLPAGSWWGSYARGQGTYSLSGYFIIFFITAFTLRNKQQLERILVTIALTSIPIVIYGFAQKLKLEPLSWDADFSIRIASTLGNPIFLGSYLIMVIPITVGLLILSLTGRASGIPKAFGTVGASRMNLRSLFYVLLLLAQVFCLLLTESRGPVLGLIIGLFLFIVLMGFVFRRKYLAWGSFITVSLLIAFLIILAIPNTPLGRFKPMIGRLSQMFEAKEGAAQVRLLIWQGVVTMVKSDHFRAMIGYGPETMFVPYHKYSPPELVVSENRIAFPDRAHNELFDTVITNGLLGTLIYLLLFAITIFYTFKYLGLISSIQDTIIFIALLTLSAIGGMFIPIYLNKTIFMAVGIPIGIVIGTVGYLFYRLVKKGEITSLTPTRTGGVGALGDSEILIFIIALFSAIIGHFIETQFGIALTAARTYFYLFLAILVVIISKGLQEGGKSDAHSVRRPTYALTFIIILILSTLVFNFITTQVSEENTIQITRVIVIILSSWIIFNAFLYLFHRSFIMPCLVSGVAIILFIAILISFLPPLHIPTKTIVIFYIWLIVNIFILGWLLMKEETKAREEIKQSQKPVRALIPRAAYLFILVLTVWLIWVTDVNPIKGDIIYKIGAGQEKQKQWDTALNYYEQALQLSVDKGNYYGALARICIEKHYIEKDAQKKKEWYDKCQDYLIRSIKYDSLNPTRNANMGRFYRVWARESPDNKERTERFASAIKYYETACSLSPRHPILRNELGEVYHEMGNLDEAIKQYNYCLTIVPDFSETYSHLGDAYLEKKDMDNALKYYHKATKIQQKSLPDLRETNQEAMFLRTNQTVIKYFPDDFIPYYNLARFYQQKGKKQEAIGMAQKSLSLADIQNQPMIKELVEKLTLIK